MIFRRIYMNVTFNISTSMSTKSVAFRYFVTLALPKVIKTTLACECVVTTNRSSEVYESALMRCHVFELNTPKLIIRSFVIVVYRIMAQSYTYILLC